jgi:hypothetical protein
MREQFVSMTDSLAPVLRITLQQSKQSLEESRQT